MTGGALTGDSVLKKLVQNPNVKAATTSSVVGCGFSLAFVFLSCKIPSIDLLASPVFQALPAAAQTACRVFPVTGTPDLLPAGHQGRHQRAHRNLCCAHQGNRTGDLQGRSGCTHHAGTDRRAKAQVRRGTRWRRVRRSASTAIWSG